MFVYIVANQMDDMVLTGANGIVYTAPRAPQHKADADQLWDVRELSNGKWGVIYSKLFDNVLDVVYSNTNEGATVITKNKDSGTNRLWRYDNGVIISKLNGKALQIMSVNRIALSSVEKSARHQNWSFQYPHKQGESSAHYNRTLLF